jgi:hypothetical protein
MQGTLLAYDTVPPGFEIVLGKGGLCPGSQGGIWNLWWNVTLSDDPQTWDSEIVYLHALQRDLPALTEDQRLIRAQMAELCRRHPPFPHSIDLLCRSIGRDRFQGARALGCEGRGLLGALGHDYQADPDYPTTPEAVIAAYRQGLEGWLAEQAPTTILEAKIHALLDEGDETAIREAVSDFLTRLSPEADMGRLFRDGVADAGFEPSNRRPWNCLLACPPALEKPCCIERALEGLLAILGGLSPARGSEILQRVIQEAVLAYALALNGWLSGLPLVELSWPIQGQIVDRPGAAKIASGVYDALGAPNAVKSWLTGCLLKTLTGNQRWHKGTELIDQVPAATAWLAGGS